MTGQELTENIDKVVYVNEQGRRSFSDVDGKFYLVGYSFDLRVMNNKRQGVYCGHISRTKKSRRSLSINAAYLELSIGGF